MKQALFSNFVLAVILVICLGALLVLGRPILLPIVTAAISAYVILSATRLLRRLPVLRHFPTVVLRLGVLIAFTVAFLSVAVIIASTICQIADVAPRYQANPVDLVERLAERFDFESAAVWQALHDATIGRIDVQSLVLTLLGSFTSIGSGIFLVVLYTGFLLAERSNFDQKLTAAFPDSESAGRLRSVVADINQRISDYLAVKTLVNIILGGVSYVILLGFDVNFALFWAVAIGLMNYIPYLGSLLGVVFPVLMSLAQFGTLGATLGLGACLVAAQVLVGSVIDPRMVGRQVNLSPFVILVALSVWTAIWGIPGAILAIPLTSMLAIVLSSFDSTRFVAVLMADRVGPAPAPGPAKAGLQT